MASLPQSVRELLRARTFWHFVTLGADGAPTATPVWVDLDGEHVLVNTAAGRRKERNVRRDPRVVLAMVGLGNPYAWVEITGRVAELVEGEEADASIEALARKYLGQGFERTPGERRVLVRIEPLEVRMNVESGGRE